MTGIPPEIRALLACPRCHGALTDVVTDSRPELDCAACGLRYPVEDGIPVLLSERARPASGQGSP